MLPPPATTAKRTTMAVSPWPPASRTLTVGDTGTTWPTATDWLFPETISSAAGGPI